MEKLTPEIYERLIGKFETESDRLIEYLDTPSLNKLSQIRKSFPTYEELLAMDLLYVDRPSIDVGDGNMLEMKTWIYRFGNTVDHTQSANLADCSVVYEIGFVRGLDPKSLEPVIELKIRGVPSIKVLKDYLSSELGKDCLFTIKQLRLLKKVLSK